MQKKNGGFLLIICWLVYMFSYVGKLSYNTNIIQIESFYGVSHSQAGLVSTFFFFAYGLGQFINGLFCKKYNLKFLIPIVLGISAICNFLVSIVSNFSWLKFIWLVNGCAMSTLWPSLIRFLSENTSENSMKKAAITMGTSYTIGTILCYCLSSLFVALGNFKIIFYFACISLPILSLVWFFSYEHLLAKKVDNQENLIEETQVDKNKKIGTFLISTIVIFSIFAIIADLIKDGLTTWLPNILKDFFGISDSISILLTIVLPIVSAFGVFLGILFDKKSKNYTSLFLVLFALTSASILFIALFGKSSLIFMLISLALIAFLLSGACNILTSFIPLEWKDKINSGLLAGVLNGFCYIGGTLSAYCLGVLSDSSGWNAVFIVLCALSFLCVVISVVFQIIIKIKRPKEN